MSAGGYAPTTKPLLTSVMQTLGVELPAMQLSVASGILGKRFKDRYGREPCVYTIWMGRLEVVLHMCFDHDLDIVLEAIVAVVSGNVVDRPALLKLRPSTREAAAAA